MDTGTILVVFLFPLAFLILAGVMLLVVMRTAGLRFEQANTPNDKPDEDVDAPKRPWWGNPLLWLAISAVFVLLGVFVLPQLFGGVFLFLPFVWVGGRGFRARNGSSAKRG